MYTCFYDSHVYRLHWGISPPFYHVQAQKAKLLKKEEEQTRRKEELVEKRRQELQVKKQQREERQRKVTARQAAIKLEMERKKKTMAEVSIVS